MNDDQCGRLVHDLMVTLGEHNLDHYETLGALAIVTARVLCAAQTREAAERDKRAFQKSVTGVITAAERQGFTYWRPQTAH